MIDTDKVKTERAIAHIQVGTEVDKKTEVAVLPSVDLITIENSKLWYKPNEQMQLRIFSLDSQLKPVEQELKSIFIRNPKGVVIKQWNNMRTERGLIEINFQLTRETALGAWTVEVVSMNDFKVVKSIDVKTEEQHPFTVDVKQPKYIVKDAQELEFEICAQDRKQFPVKGNMNITIGYKPTAYEQHTPISVAFPSETFNRNVSFTN